MLKTLRRWWQSRTGQTATPFDGEAPYYVFSLLFHVILVLALGSVVYYTPGRPLMVLESDTDAQVIEEIELTELAISDLPQEEIGDLGEAIDEGLKNEAQTIAIQALAPMEQPLIDDFGSTFAPDVDSILAAEEANPNVIARGASGVGVAGATGAVDQITDEILRACDQGPVLAIWLFDQSASLQPQRQEIKQRFDRVYRELDTILNFTDESKPLQSAPLLTQVYQYASGLKSMLPKPSRDIDAVLSTFDQIQDDDAGIERSFAAIAQALTDHKTYLRDSKLSDKRKIMLLVVTDEVGDDRDLMDQVIEMCRRAAAPVYVIGVPAPFGTEKVRFKWVDPDPDYDQDPQWATLDQGPETLLPERIQLGFFGMPDDDLETMDSGFGPFALSRLAVETGGIYFTVHPNRQLTGRRVTAWETSPYASHINYFFDPLVMQRYRPDYINMERYQKGLKQNPCREALVRASMQSGVGALTTPGLRFPKLDEAEFVNSLSQAQRAAALLEPQVEQLYAILAVGETSRARELVPRWQAGYDLAMGRVLAAKVRTEAYNAMLAAAKTRLKFEDPKNNTWELKGADTIEVGSRLANLAEQATMYLTRVVREHPKTPWAKLAERELSTPLGWKWEESYTQPPSPPAMNNNNNNNIPNPNDERAMMLERKPRRAPPRL
ncbi:MAG: VWA domain-containing protein [Pirellulaceae bacterium]|nr:VWA domain-containing protein [Pirellulaceae bacterium]